MIRICIRDEVLQFKNFSKMPKIGNKKPFQTSFLYDNELEKQFYVFLLCKSS